MHDLRFQSEWGTLIVKIAVGKNIKAQRDKKGWSQQDLAGQLRLSRQTISKWELGRSYPDIENLVRLSQLFHVSTDKLLDLKPVKPKKPAFSWLFRKRSSKTMTTIKWDTSGQSKARVATGLIVEIVANLDPEKERPLRELLAAYYTELINQRSGSNLAVLRRLYLGVSKCMQQNGIILDADNEQRLNALLALGSVRYPS